jgi:hypothetical protein
MIPLRPARRPQAPTGWPKGGVRFVFPTHPATLGIRGQVSNAAAKVAHPQACAASGVAGDQPRHVWRAV